MCTAQMFAQDIIIMRNGKEIQAKVAKINNDNIEYKKWTNQYGPIYTVPKQDVFLIKYVNGDKDIFTDEDTQPKPQQSSNSAEPKYIKKSPADNNQQLIDRYKAPVHFAKAPSDKDSKWFFPIMAMSDSSIVSNSDMELKIIPTIVQYFNTNAYMIKYSIELQNKTDKVVYVDLANSFRINCDGTSKSYFSTEQTTVNHGSSSGAGVNLGGITNALGIGGIIGTLAGATTVGSSNQHSVATTYTNQRFLAIPPHSKKNLTEYKQVKVKKNEYEIISDIEEYVFYKNDLRGILKKNNYLSYSEKESPYTAQYIITYSTTQSFLEYSSLYAKLYARYIYGGHYFVLPVTQKDAIKDVQEHISNFWENPGIIVGGCSYLPRKK